MSTLPLVHVRVREAFPEVSDFAAFNRVVALFVDGKNTADIADIVGLPEAAVANSLHRYREFHRKDAAA